VHVSATAGAGATTAGVGVAVRRLVGQPEAQAAAGEAVAAGALAVVLPFVQPSSGPRVAQPLAAPPTVHRPATPAATSGPRSSPEPTGATPPEGTTPDPVLSPVGGVGLTATLEPLGPLARGRPGLLVLTVTNPPAEAGGASVPISAVF